LCGFERKTLSADLAESYSKDDSSGNKSYFLLFGKLITDPLHSDVYFAFRGAKTASLICKRRRRLLHSTQKPLGHNDYLMHIN